MTKIRKLSPVKNYPGNIEYTKYAIYIYIDTDRERPTHTNNIMNKP